VAAVRLLAEACELVYVCELVYMSASWSAASIAIDCETGAGIGAELVATLTCIFADTQVPYSCSLDKHDLYQYCMQQQAATMHLHGLRLADARH
jgi:hypothetical protein